MRCSLIPHVQQCLNASSPPVAANPHFLKIPIAAERHCPGCCTSNVCQAPASSLPRSSRCTSLQELHQKKASDYHHSHGGRSLFSWYWDTTNLSMVDTVSTLIHELVWPGCIDIYRGYQVRHGPNRVWTAPAAPAGLEVWCMWQGTICRSVVPCGFQTVSAACGHIHPGCPTPGKVGACAK